MELYLSHFDLKALVQNNDFILVFDHVNLYPMANLITALNISFKYIPPYFSFLNPCKEVFWLAISSVR
ncbi:LOW QUALITY PROTEIN: hypothetical protein HZS_330 [Henneguya salminicola]|nr:LOW QUALITY PROTEIN: hypothetical protein HZS_330 [Henneguya salminicola]